MDDPIQTSHWDFVWSSHTAPGGSYSIEIPQEGGPIDLSVLMMHPSPSYDFQSHFAEERCLSPTLEPETSSLSSSVHFTSDDHDSTISYVPSETQDFSSRYNVSFYPKLTLKVV